MFFAPARQQELLSEKIHQMLYGIYKNKSLMKVLLISESYLAGDWTDLEKRVSLQSTERDRKRLLIVNYTAQLVLPGKLQSLQYLDGRKYSEDEIAALITERMREHVLKSMENDYKKSQKQDEEDNFRDKSGNIVINRGGVVTGNNAHFGDIYFGEGK